MPTLNVTTTKLAREKLAKAHAGESALPPIVEIGFGTGGHDVITGDPTEPSDEVNIVSDEVLRKAIEGYSFPVDTTLRILGELDYAEANGEGISAIGLYDDDGDLVALKHTIPRIKTADMKLVIEWDEQF